MRVFTDEWVTDLKRRYAHLPAYQRPSTYFLAVEDYNEGMRFQIEEWVEALPSPVHHDLIQRLRSQKNLIHTYHELVVGNLLRREGYQLDYEKEVDGLTPDWYVHEKGEIPAFLLEVFTSDLPNERGSEHHQIQQLRSRLEEIPRGIALNIYSERLNVTLDDRRCKDISGRVRRWLMDGERAVGAKLEVDEFTFHVVQINEQYPCVQPIGPATSFMVKHKPLRNNLESKVKKYRRVARKRGLPLVIGVIADFGTGLRLDHLQAELLGRTVDNLIRDIDTGKILRREITNMNDGLFLAEPVLSAAVWVERITSSEWVLKAIHNPSALLPLPGSAFVS